MLVGAGFKPAPAEQMTPNGYRLDSVVATAQNMHRDGRCSSLLKPAPTISRAASTFVLAISPSPFVGRHQSSSILASLATLRHIVTWRSTRARISAGVVPRTSLPAASSLLRTSGTAIAFITSACNRLTIACGVLAGAAIPDHEIT